jgi:hypothetical protein
MIISEKMAQKRSGEESGECTHEFDGRTRREYLRDIGVAERIILK